jgi:hypothetical protein
MVKDESYLAKDAEEEEPGADSGEGVTVIMEKRKEEDLRYELPPLLVALDDSLDDDSGSIDDLERKKEDSVGSGWRLVNAGACLG